MIGIEKKNESLFHCLGIEGYEGEHFGARFEMMSVRSDRCAAVLMAETRSGGSLRPDADWRATGSEFNISSGP